MKAGALIEPTKAGHSPTQGHPTVVGIDARHHKVRCLGRYGTEQLRTPR